MLCRFILKLRSKTYLFPLEIGITLANEVERSHQLFLVILVIIVMACLILKKTENDLPSEFLFAKEIGEFFCINQVES